jgi:hypothetical protein
MDEFLNIIRIILSIAVFFVIATGTFKIVIWICEASNSVPHPATGIFVFLLSIIAAITTLAYERV